MMEMTYLNYSNFFLVITVMVHYRLLVLYVMFALIVDCFRGMRCRGSKTGRLLFQLQSQPVGLRRVNKVIVVACMDKTLQCFNIKVCCMRLIVLCCL